MTQHRRRRRATELGRKTDVPTDGETASPLPDQYARARLSGYEQLADSLVDISDDKAGRPSGTACVHDDRNAVSSPLGNGLSLVETFQLGGAAADAR